MILSSCPYVYATLNFCRHLKSEIHLRNGQVNKSPSVNNSLTKTFLVVCGHDKEQLLANRLLLLVGCTTSFRLVLVRFECFRVLVQLKDKNLFSTPMKIHTMVRKVKEQNNFVLVSCACCAAVLVTPFFRYRIILLSPLFVLC